MDSSTNMSFVYIPLNVSNLFFAPTPYANIRLKLDSLGLIGGVDGMEGAGVIGGVDGMEGAGVIGGMDVIGGIGDCLFSTNRPNPTITNIQAIKTP